MSFARAVTAAMLVLSCAFISQSADATLVSGNVTDATTSAPLQGVSVQVFESFPDPLFSANTTTDLNGNYQIDVPPGYPQITASLDSYVAQTQYLTLDSTPQTTNFALALAGSIAGTVRIAASGEPLADSTVELVDAASQDVVATAYSADDGTYAFDAIAPGPYAVCVINGDDVYLDVCYDGRTLPADGTIVFTPVAIAGGQHLTGIDFSLQLGVTLSGTLHDSYSNTPIANSQIEFALYSPQQAQILTLPAITDGNGSFTLRGLAPGSYYLQAGVSFIGYNTNAAYTSRLYGGGECGRYPQCPFDTGTLINVPSIGVTGIDLGLFPGYVVTGKVTDAQTGFGIPNVTINSCDNPSGFLPGISGTAVTDANGNYAVAHVIGVQTYIATIDAPAYLNVVWPNAVTLPSYNCLDASIFGGNTLGFTSVDQVLANVNFTLQRGAAISGNITASDIPNMPVSSKVSLYSTDAQGMQWVATISSDADGNYTTVGVVPGTYYVVAYFDNGADCQLYSEMSCGSGWDATNPGSEDFSSATPITLTGTQLQSGVDLQLKVKIFNGSFD